jgi:hypothetical protein
MDELTRRLVKLFIEMGSESLDLHTLFEARGNDPESRKRVLDVVTDLIDTGFLESRGSDFYLPSFLVRRFRHLWRPQQAGRNSARPAADPLPPPAIIASCSRPTFCFA